MTDGRPFDAVPFDMDGVLVDSEQYWNEVRIAFATAHGRPRGPEDQHAVMGGNTRQWAATLQARLRLEDMEPGPTTPPRVGTEARAALVLAWLAAVVPLVGGG